MKRQRISVSPIHEARCVAFSTEDKAEAFAETLERQCSPVYENVDVNRIGLIRQLAAKLPAHQSSSGHEQDCRPDNRRQAAEGNG
ncbi:hypothetical protein Trydic_g2192 [Trypoxylus dichotomus]